MKKPKSGTIVSINWDDAMSHDGWVKKGGVLVLGKCESIGRVQYVNKKAICIAAISCKTNSTIDQLMSIPLSCVTKVTELVAHKRKRNV